MSDSSGCSENLSLAFYTLHKRRNVWETLGASRGGGGQKAGDPIQVESHSKPKLSHHHLRQTKKTGLSNLVLTQVIKT